MHAICDITVVLKEVAQNPAVLATRDSGKTLAKRLLLLYCKSSVATI